MKRKKTEKPKDGLVWISLKTTGLDPRNDHILEVGCIITDRDLVHISPCFQAALRQSPDVISKFAGHCPTSELAKECEKSPYALENVESALTQFIVDRVTSKSCVLAGDNIGEIIPFLRECFPSLFPILHHRIVDVGTLRELCWRWYPSEYTKIPKRPPPKRVIQGILDSIDDLRWYRSNIFASSERRIITLTMPKKP